MSVAIGSAISKKINKDDRLVYCLCGDGELQEGQIWEAIMYAGAKEIDNLILTIDVNKQQICGSTDDILNLGNINQKISAFNWDVIELKNGNNIKKMMLNLIKEIIDKFLKILL